MNTNARLPHPEHNKNCVTRVTCACVHTRHHLWKTKKINTEKIHGIYSWMNSPFYFANKDNSTFPLQNHLRQREGNINRTVKNKLVGSHVGIIAYLANLGSQKYRSVLPWKLVLWPERQKLRKSVLIGFSSPKPNFSKITSVTGIIDRIETVGLNVSRNRLVSILLRHGLKHVSICDSWL